MRVNEDASIFGAFFLIKEGVKFLLILNANKRKPDNDICLGNQLIRKIEEKIGYQSKKFREEFMEILKKTLKKMELEEKQQIVEHIYFQIDELKRGDKSREAIGKILVMNSEHFKQIEEKLERNDYHRKMTKEEAMQAVTLYAGSYEFLPARFKENFDIALRTVEKDPWQMRHMPLRLRNSERIALAAVSREGETLGLVGYKQKRNSQVIAAALRNDRDAENILTANMKDRSKEVKRKRPPLEIHSQRTGKERTING